jgi:hypothetical protein
MTSTQFSISSAMVLAISAGPDRRDAENCGDESGN